MNKTNGHSQLDRHIRETLKNAGPHIPLIDWNQIEPLLPSQQKSISFWFSKKTITILFLTGAVALLSFGTYKIIRHYSSLPVTENPIDSVTNILSVVDTITGQDSIFAIPDTTLKDSSLLLEKETKVDSASAVTSADIPSLKETNEKSSVNAIKNSQSGEQAKKQNNEKKNTSEKNREQIQLDTSSKKMPVESRVLGTADTAKSLLPKTIREPTSSDSVGTGNKSTAEKKSKKQKKQKPSATQSAIPSSPTEIKPDTSFQR